MRNYFFTEIKKSALPQNRPLYMQIDKKRLAYPRQDLQIACCLRIKFSI